MPHAFEVRPDENGLVLTGGQLEPPLYYPPQDMQSVLHVVGFLSQRDGSELRVFDWEGKLVSERKFPAGVPLSDNAKLGPDDH